MLAFIGCNMAHSSKDVSAMGGSTLNAIAVIDATLASLSIAIKVLEIVVKVGIARTQIASQQCRVCRKDGGDGQFAFLDQRDRNTGLPFVEMRNDRRIMRLVQLISHRI